MFLQLHDPDTNGLASSNERMVFNPILQAILANPQLFSQSQNQKYHLQLINCLIRRINPQPSKVASDFTKVELSKILKKEHKGYFKQVLSSLLNNPKISERDLDPSPLSFLEIDALTSLIHRIYGGTVSHHTKKPLKEKISELAAKFYSLPESLSVSVGCFINTLQNKVDGIKDKTSLFCKAASLSYATLHKVIKNAVPNFVASKGRDPKQNKDKVSFFIKKEILNT